MPSVHGLRYNGLSLSPDARTFVDVLAAASYDTASIGKSHVEHFLTTPPFRPKDVTERLVPEAWAEKPIDSAEEPANFEQEERYAVRKPYFGYDHVDIVSNHGDRCGGHYKQWLRAVCPDWEQLWDSENELPHNYSCPQARRTPVPEDLYPSTYVADRAIEYLADPQRGQNPFFAFVSFPDPHHPFNPPGRYWDMYSPDDFEIALPFDAHQNPPPHILNVQKDFETGAGAATAQTGQRVDDMGLRQAMALTAGMITMVDDQIGRIIEALKSAGLYENTVICFNSDHGDFMGDFGMLLKGAWPLPSITRVPMIWSDPADRTAQVSEAMASTIDIGPSILARAGLAPYNGIQGISFLQALDGSGQHRDEVLIEYNDAGPRMGLDVTAQIRTLRDKNWRLSLYAGLEWGELYDLQADPNETRNLWDDPDAQEIKGELALRLARLLTDQMDQSPLSERLA